MMHFHESSVCIACTSPREYSTPIPDVLILASNCDVCGATVVVGLEEDAPCLGCLRQLVAELIGRGLRAVASD